MRANYNHIKMKKLVYLLAAGSMAFVACQNSPSYKVTGSVEDTTDGDTIYLQEYAGGDLVKLDSAIVKKRELSFTGKQDTAVNRYITYKERKQALLKRSHEYGSRSLTLAIDDTEYLKNLGIKEEIDMPRIFLIWNMPILMTGNSSNI